GAGPIGCWRAVMARGRGAGAVFLSDVSRQRLDLALAAVGGFVDDARVATDDNRPAEVLERTNGAGADRISVAAPSKQAQQAALEMAAKRARVVYFAGLPKHDPVSPLDMNQLHYKELAILGAYGATTPRGAPAKNNPAPQKGGPPPGRLGGPPPPVPDHHGLPQPAPEGAGPGGDPPVPPGADLRGVRDHPLRDRPEDGRGPVTGPYVIGCDVGSQGTNAALYAADGRLVASAYVPY